MAWLDSALPASSSSGSSSARRKASREASSAFLDAKIKEGVELRENRLGRDFMALSTAGKEMIIRGAAAWRPAGVVQ